MKTIVLVSCVSKKLSRSAPAQDLYQTCWFKKARAFAEQNGDIWYILSAKHGLVDPNTVIPPYDATLPAGKSARRQDWAQQVIGSLQALAPAPVHVIILAGMRYRDPLLSLLKDAGYHVDVPMMGLGIGQQLAWLKSNTMTTLPLFATLEPTR